MIFEKTTTSHKNFFYIAMSLYAAALVYLYFFRAAVNYARILYDYYNGYNMEMTNLVPFKNILFYIKNIGNFTSDIIIYNLLFPVAVWLPCGLLFQWKISTVRRAVIVLLCVLIIFSLRFFIIKSFFDIDKVILAMCGYFSGQSLMLLLRKAFPVRANNGCE